MGTIREEMAEPEVLGGVLSDDSEGQNLLQMWQELTERVLSFGKRKRTDVAKIVKKYRKLRVLIVSDADVMVSLDSLKQAFLEVGLTERCLSKVTNVSVLLDVLELQLIIDLEEASFLYLNHLVKHSKDEQLKEKRLQRLLRTGLTAE